MFYNSHESCLLCGNRNLKDLKGYERHYLVKCERCGFVFTKRIPTDSELEKHYSNYSYSREHYLSPITIKRYNELLDEFEKYRKTNKILDVGCGIGYFLEQARKRGWQTYGTEYSAAAVEICRSKGIAMTVGVLDSKDYEKESFDIVTSFEVIEHINNPLSEMAHIRDILRPGGLFYCTTPNFNALTRYWLKDRYNIIEYPEHLSYYTPRTINFLLTKAGFRKLKILTTGISLTRIRQVVSSSDQKLISRYSDDEMLRVQIEQKPLLQAVKKIINGALTFTGNGMALKAYFEKR